MLQDSNEYECISKASHERFSSFMENLNRKEKAEQEAKTKEQNRKVRNREYVKEEVEKIVQVLLSKGFPESSIESYDNFLKLPSCNVQIMILEDDFEGLHTEGTLFRDGIFLPPRAAFTWIIDNADTWDEADRRTIPPRTWFGRQKTVLEKVEQLLSWIKDGAFEETMSMRLLKQMSK